MKKGKMKKNKMKEMVKYAKEWISTADELHEIEQLHPEEVFEFSEFEKEDYELKKKAIIKAMWDLGYEFLGIAGILDTLGHEVVTYGGYIRSLVFEKIE